MALSDWTIFKSDPLIKVTIDYRAPIAGGGSLLLADNAVTGNPQAVLVRTLAQEKGILHAKIRTLVRLAALDGAGVGIVFMLNQEDISTDQGQFYGAFIGETRVDGTSELVLAKFIHGLQNAPTTILYHAAYAPVGVCALEVEWDSDLATLGGTRVIIRRSDPTVDTVVFNTLITVYDAIDTATPIVVTAAEGIAYHNVFAGTNSFFLDKTLMVRGE